MRIVHCVPIFSELTQTFVYELVGNMSSCLPEQEIRVLTWQRRNAEARPYEPVDIVPSPGSREILRVRVGRAMPESVERALFPPTSFERAVTDSLTSVGADLVHAHFGPTAVLIGRACRHARVPLLVTFRGRDASAKLRKWHWRRLYRRTLMHAAAVTCVSEDLRRQLAPVLPASLDARVVLGGKQSQRLEYRSPPVPRGRLVSVGRLIGKKGHADGIRAVALARERGTEVTLTIIGGGPLRAGLEQEIARLGLEDAVTLTGALPYSQVIKHLQAADFLLAANRTAENGDSEGIPNVVKEAQLVGLPLVATRHGGIPQAVSETERRQLVDEGDIEGLAERIIELCQLSPEVLERIARSGREHVLENFDPLTEVRAYHSLYEEILAGTG